MPYEEDIGFCLAAAMVLGGCSKGTENTEGETALTVVTSFILFICWQQM